MEKINNAPLWLDLKKEYIDVNIDKLQEYLATISEEDKLNDSFYKKTMSLLKERVQDFLCSITKEHLYIEQDIKKAYFNIRLFCIYLLSDKESNIVKIVFLALLREIQKVKPNYSEAILKACDKCISHSKISKLGVSWEDLEDISSDLFAHKLVYNSEFCCHLERPLLLSNKGIVIISDGNIFISPNTIDEATDLINKGKYSLSTDKELFRIVSKSYNLKSDGQLEFEAIDDFTDSIISQLRPITKHVSQTNKQYDLAAEVIVEVIYIDKNNLIHAKTTDPNYEELKGIVKCQRRGFYGYDTTKFYKYFKPGDFVQATIKLDDQTNDLYFDIEDQLREFVNNAVCNRDSNEVFAKLVKASQSKEDLWLSEYGIPIYTDNAHSVKEGECAWLGDFSCGDGSYRGHIKAFCISFDENEMPFDDKEARKEFVRSFATLQHAPNYYNNKADFDNIEPEILYLVLQLFYNHLKNEKNAIEKFKTLSVLNVLSEVVGKEQDSSFIRFLRKYILAIILFTYNKKLDKITLTPEEGFSKLKQTRLRIIILRLLKEYGKDSESFNIIDSIINEELEFQDNNNQILLKNLSSLIKAANLIKDTKDDEDSNDNKFDNRIRKQISDALCVKMENGIRINDVNISLGEESQTMEHKKSYIFSADGKKDQPSEIYRVICGFLNSISGGVLNIGVNNFGMPEGLSEDIEYLRNKNPNYFRSNDDMDAYMRYIQDNGMKRFGKIGTILFSSYINFSHERLNKKSYLKIKIDSYPHGIVKFDNQSHLRANSETKVLNEDEEKELLKQKIFTNKHSENCLLKLFQALNDKKCVIIRNYRSSNSKTIKDRKVECFQITPDQKMAICYEMGTENLKIKGFKIDRMGEIQVLDENWTHEDEHIEQSVDVFNMVGGSPIEVSLKMDLFARNQLIEEYPMAKPLIKKGENINAWYFSENVGKIEGIGRFILGVADHVEIVGSSELKNYIAEYTKDNLLKYLE